MTDEMKTPECPNGDDGLHCSCFDTEWGCCMCGEVSQLVKEAEEMEEGNWDDEVDEIEECENHCPCVEDGHDCCYCGFGG